MIVSQLIFLQKQTQIARLTKLSQLFSAAKRRPHRANLAAESVNTTAFQLLRSCWGKGCFSCGAAAALSLGWKPQGIVLFLPAHGFVHHIVIAPSVIIVDSATESLSNVIYSGSGCEEEKQSWMPVASHGPTFSTGSADEADTNSISNADAVDSDLAVGGAAQLVFVSSKYSQDGKAVA